ncbi:hypothetical protein E4U55_005510 [Claviceps digitariae]|nr:hypothetical protein E4U55_005510 [Claviceps digitariae]
MHALIRPVSSGHEDISLTEMKPLTKVEELRNFVVLSPARHVKRKSSRGRSMYMHIPGLAPFLHEQDPSQWTSFPSLIRTPGFIADDNECHSRGVYICNNPAL